MGYQPKFAPKGPQRPSVWFILLGLVIVPLSLFLTGKMLLFFYANTGRPKPNEPGAAQDVLVAQKIDAYVAGQLAAARQAIASDEQLQAPPETEPPPPVIYTIDPAAAVAPEPNQALFGETTDPEVMEELLQKAARILEGQTTYFSPDTERFDNTPVRYYLDDSIFAVTWKEAHDSSVYTFSEVKIAHPSQFRRHLSGGEFGAGVLYLPTEMAATVNAVVAASGDYYANRPVFGIMAYEGKVRRSVSDGYAETCYIDENGDMVFSYMKQLRNETAAQAFLDENHLQFSLAFGPILVDNYEVREIPNVYGVGQIFEEYARAALCQMDKLHYLVAVANWEGNQKGDPTVPQFQKVVAATGCRMAYCLDGGQTAAIVMNDQLINRPAKGEQRRISDIIYFATAVPEGG